MKNFIVAFAISVVLLSCTAEQSKKLDVVGQINQDMIKNPSAAGGTGTNYYVCDDGDDTNDGLSEQTPWKSFDKGVSVFNSLEAGDAVLFCTGGVFNVSSRKTIFNENCNVDSPCIISSYSNSGNSEEKPVLYSPDGDIFNFADSGSSDRDGGYLISDIYLRGGGVGIGLKFANDVDDVLIDNVVVDGFLYGMFIGGSNEPREGSDSDALNERIILSNSLVKNSTRRGYYTKCSGGCELIDNVFQNNNNDPLDENITSDTSNEATALVSDENSWPSGFNGVIYVCDTGSDDNDGVSPVSPLQTFSYAIPLFNKLPAGGVVAFCRGGVFSADKKIRLFNRNCRANNKCMITDYGDSFNLAKPIIESSDGGLEFSDSGDPDQDGGYYISNLNLKGQGVGNGIAFLNDVDDVIIENVRIDNFARGVMIGNRRPANANSDGKMDRITFKRSSIVNTQGNGYLGGCDDCKILGNYFENNGSMAVFHHNVYIGFGNKEYPFKNMEIEGNTLYKSNSIDGVCRGVSLVVHGRIDGIKISGNIIKEDIGTASMGCWGISLDPGYSTDEYFKNIVIRDNSLQNLGGHGIGCSSCENVVIEGNTIAMQSNQKMNAIRVPIKQDESIQTTNVEIRDNTIELAYYGEKANMNTGVYISESQGNYNVIGNRIKTLNKLGANECIYDRNIDMGSVSNVTRSNNLCINYN